MTRIVGREFDRGVVVDPDQVADRVAVFNPIEAPDGHPARVGIPGVDPERLVLDPIFQGTPLLGGWPRLAGRRHDAGAHVFEHGQPEIVIAQVGIAGPELVQNDSAFLQSIAVAAIAMVFKNRPDLLVELVVDTLRGGQSAGK